MKPNEHFKQKLHNRAEHCRSLEKACFADSRADEAVLERIRGNVYEIFLSIADTAAKVKQDEEIYPFLQEKLTQIPSSWEKARNAALTHGDSERAALETIKLETAQVIRQIAQEIWES